MKTEWRPDDWGLIHCQLYNRYEYPHTLIEQTASAMLTALLKWLNEKCPHTKEYVRNTEIIVLGGFEHRYLCPQCMTELKENGL